MRQVAKCVRPEAGYEVESRRSEEQTPGKYGIIGDDCKSTRRRCESFIYYIEKGSKCVEWTRYDNHIVVRDVAAQGV